MSQASSMQARDVPAGLHRGSKRSRSGADTEHSRDIRLTGSNSLTAALEAERGIAKVEAAKLFARVATTSATAAGRLRAELIPDSSWKRAGETLGPQASQTVSRLGHMLRLAERVWGNEADAVEWLNSPHAELHGATPYSMLRTEAGGRVIEGLLAALEFGFPI